MSKVVDTFGQLSVLIDTPENQNLSYWSRSKFQWLFDQGKGNLAQVRREFELSKFALTKGKRTGKWGEIQGKLDLLWISREFELSELKLSGFYCIHTISQMASIFQPPCLWNFWNALSPVRSESYNRKTPSHSDFPFFPFFFFGITGRLRKYAQFGLFYAKIFQMTLLLHLNTAGYRGNHYDFWKFWNENSKKIEVFS